MGTASYVPEGLGNAESFETCQHGAGRTLSRAAARKSKTSTEVYDDMGSLGVVLRSSDPKGVADEAAFAYKDIESVMAASASLVRPTKRLAPLGVVRASPVTEVAGPPGRRLCHPPREESHRFERLVDVDRGRTWAKEDRAALR